MVQELLSLLNSLVKAHTQRNENMSTQTLVQECLPAILFIIAQKQKQLRWRLNWWTDKKMWYYSCCGICIQPQKTILILATTWMDLKNFMLKWKTVTKNDILYSSCIWNFQRGKSMRLENSYYSLASGARGRGKEHGEWLLTDVGFFASDDNVQN